MTEGQEGQNDMLENHLQGGQHRRSNDAEDQDQELEHDEVLRNHQQQVNYEVLQDEEPQVQEEGEDPDDADELQQQNEGLQPPDEISPEQQLQQWEGLHEELQHPSGGALQQRTPQPQQPADVPQIQYLGYYPSRVGEGPQHLRREALQHQRQRNIHGGAPQLQYLGTTPELFNNMPRARVPLHWIDHLIELRGGPAQYLLVRARRHHIFPGGETQQQQLRPQGNLQQMFGRGPRQQPQAGGGNQQQPQMERGSVSRDPRVLISILRMKARAMGNERWRGTYNGMNTKRYMMELFGARNTDSRWRINSLKLKPRKRTPKESNMVAIPNPTEEFDLTENVSLKHTIKQS